MAYRSVAQRSDEIKAESSYSARTIYLNGMKKFMADLTGMSKSSPDERIEEYLQYEKKISHDIQKKLGQCQ